MNTPTATPLPETFDTVGSLRQLLREMPDIGAFAWYMDGVDRDGRVRDWLRRRKLAIGEG